MSEQEVKESFIDNNKLCTVFAWLICGIGSIYYSYEYFLRISPSIMEYALRKHFNLSATGFGLLSASYYYAYVPMQLPVGILLDRYGPRLLLTIACLFCVFGTFIFPRTSCIYIAIIGRFLVGFGSSFAFVGVLKLATIWLPENKLALVAGIAAALGTIGAMIGDNILGSLVISTGWKETIDITAYFGIILIFILWFGVRDKHENNKLVNTIATFKKSFIDLSIIIHNKQIWLNGLFGCLVYLPTTVFAELWGISYLIYAHGFTQTEANFSNSLLFLGFTIGAPIIGYISDRFKRRRLPMLIGAIGSAITMIVILYFPGLKEYYIYFLMFILGFLYSVQCIVFAVGREVSPKEYSGTAMAMTNMIVMLGAMFLQPIIGHLLDFSISFHSNATQRMLTLGKYTISDYQFALSTIPIGMSIAAVLTLFIKETHANSIYE